MKLVNAVCALGVRILFPVVLVLTWPYHAAICWIAGEKR